MLNKSILSLIFITTLVFQGCTDKKQEDISKANSMLSLNEYVLTGLDNKQYVLKKEDNGFTLKDTKAKIIILDVFATWCPPCQKGASHLNSIQEKYKDDVLVIGVNIEDSIPNSKLLTFREKFNANYVLVNSKQNRPLADAVAKQLHLGDSYPIPAVAIYKDGKLVKHYIGSIQEEFIQSDIKLLLGKK